MLGDSRREEPGRSRTRRGPLALASLVLASGCGPIPEELATTSIGLMPLCFAFSAFIVSFRSSGRRSADGESGEVDEMPKRLPWASVLVGAAVLGCMAVPALLSVNFEGGAAVFAILILGAATLGYTLLADWMTKDKPGPHPMGWVPHFVCAVLVLPWLMTLASSGAGEDAWMNLGIGVVLFSAFVLVPMAMLMGIVGLLTRPKLGDDDFMVDDVD